MLTDVNHITLAVTDIEGSIDFYQNVLGFSVEAKWESAAYLMTGTVWLCLCESQSVGVRSDYSHIAFSTSEEGIQELRERLSTAGTRSWKQNASEGDSIYFLDPDGHRLEAHIGNLASRLRSMKARGFPADPQAEGCT